MDKVYTSEGIFDALDERADGALVWYVEDGRLVEMFYTEGRLVDIGSVGVESTLDMFHDQLVAVINGVNEARKARLPYLFDFGGEDRVQAMHDWSVDVVVRLDEMVHSGVQVDAYMAMAAMMARGLHALTEAIIDNR